MAKQNRFDVEPQGNPGMIRRAVAYIVGAGAGLAAVVASVNFIGEAIDKEAAADAAKVKPYVDAQNQREAQDASIKEREDYKAAKKADPLLDYRRAADKNGVVPTDKAICAVDRYNNGEDTYAVVVDKNDGPVVTSSSATINVGAKSNFCEVVTPSGNLKFAIDKAGKVSGVSASASAISPAPK